MGGRCSLRQGRGTWDTYLSIDFWTPVALVRPLLPLPSSHPVHRQNYQHYISAHSREKFRGSHQTPNCIQARRALISTMSHYYHHHPCHRPGDESLVSQPETWEHLKTWIQHGDQTLKLTTLPTQSMPWVLSCDEHILFGTGTHWETTFEEIERDTKIPRTLPHHHLRRTQQYAKYLASRMSIIRRWVWLLWPDVMIDPWWKKTFTWRRLRSILEWAVLQTMDINGRCQLYCP